MASGNFWRDAWWRLQKNKACVISLWVFATIVLVTLVGPLLSPYRYNAVNWDYILIPPNFEKGFYFGTDINGRDLFTRTLAGGQVSLLVGLVASGVSLFIGVLYGSISGYLGGRVDAMMMRFVDILYAVPFMFFVLMLAAFFGRHMMIIFMAIGVVEWLDMARIVRGQTLSLKRREFIEAAITAGTKPLDIIRRHILPNILGTIVIYLTLTIPRVILIESFLSFLGLGAQEPMTSWGLLIQEGAGQMETAPWGLLFPSLFLSITLLSLNFIGDGLRDVLDPKDR